ADLVGPERLRAAAVGLGGIGVVGSEPVAIREQPAVCAARGALPFMIVARPRTGEPAGAIEPRRVGERVVPRDPADWHAQAVLLRCRPAIGVVDRLPRL